MKEGGRSTQIYGPNKASDTAIKSDRVQFLYDKVLFDTFP